MPNLLERIQKKLNILNIATDIISVVLSMAIAYWIRFVIFRGESPVGSVTYHLIWAAAFSPVYVILYGLLNVYDPYADRAAGKELGRILLCNTIGTMLYVDVIFLFRIVDFSRWLIVLSYVFLNIFTGCKRLVLRRYQERRHQKGLDQMRIIIIGDGYAARALYETLRDVSGYRVLGNIGQWKLDGPLPCLGDFGQIRKILSLSTPDEAVIALDEEDSTNLRHTFLACESSGVKLSMLPLYYEYISGQPYFEQMGGLPLINVRRVPLDNAGFALVKRAMDILLSILMIVLTSPIMLAAVIGTKLSSPGPVIFRQTRIGKDRQPFEMLKFRSMRVNGQQDSGWTTEGDPRRTKFGAFMRRYSIDELPQLFNVLKGDMSLVGPRPELPRYVEHFQHSVPLYMVRHQVRPGMTGWAQVNGLRGDSSIPTRVRYDLYYLEHWSLLFDIKILLMTPFKGIVNIKEPLITHEQS